jgi:parvulin-like peptidyl-prolyl isomerase
MHYRYRSALLALSLLLSPALILAQPKPASPPPGAVAVVNGKSIPFSRYESLRQDYIEAAGRNGSSGAIEQATDDDFFLQLVDAELLEQEAVKRGITFTRKDAVRSLLADPPEFIRGPFVVDGVFRKDIFSDVVNHPERITRLVAADDPRALVTRWKGDLEKVLRFVQARELRRRVTDRLYAAKPLTENQIRDRYFAENTVVNGSFIRVLHSTIPDSLIPVTMEETKAYYNAHREDYRFTPGRSISATILPIIPTRSDSLLHRARIDSARSLLLATPLASRTARVSEMLRTLPPNRFPSDRAIPMSEIPAWMRGDLVKASEGDLVGPIYYEDDGVLLYVERLLPSTDTTLHLRHILLRVAADNRESDSTNRDLAKALAANIRDEKTFIQAAEIYSQDGSSKQGGDLGYVSRGQMIEEFERAAFAGTPGEVTGPVRTPFGYHLIWVSERITHTYLLRELRFPVAPSTAAREAVMKDARQLARVLFDRKPTDSILTALRAKYPAMISDTSLVERLDPYGDLLVSGEFAFSSRAGDVATIRLPFNRIAVLQLLQVRPGGIPELELFPNYVAAHVRRQKQLEMLRPRIERLADTLTAEMLIGPIRGIAPMAEVFLYNNQKIDPPPDESPFLLDSLLRVTPAGGVGGPVRGTHGYYFLRLIEKNGPGQAEYLAQKDRWHESYLAKYRDDLFNEMLRSARHFAEIQDLRPSTRALITGKAQ